MPSFLPYLIFIYISHFSELFSDFTIMGLKHVFPNIYAFTRILHIYNAFATRHFIDACAADVF